MNNARRRDIRTAQAIIENAQALLTDAQEILQEARDEEEEAFDNLPEGLQAGERGDAMQLNIDHLDEALASLENAISDLDDIGAATEAATE